MKCGACKYEYEFHYDDNFETVIDKGDEQFTLIRGTFLVEEERDYAPTSIRSINLFACPKCLTIRTEV